MKRAPAKPLRKQTTDELLREWGWRIHSRRGAEPTWRRYGAILPQSKALLVVWMELDKEKANGTQE